jgi:hypothetical protein
MPNLTRLLMAASSLLLVTACAPEAVQMSTADFQKPENATALQAVLSNCKLVLSTDPRAENCKAARAAKFALDAQDVARIRKQQIQAYSEEGYSMVPQTSSGTTLSASRESVVR